MKLNVEGMTCGGCVKAVTAVIKQLDDSAEVSISLETGVVETTAAVAEDVLTEALDDAGFPATVAS